MKKRNNMKKIIYMLGLGVLLLAAGCSEQEIEMYSGTEGVYFYVPYDATATDHVVSSSRIEFTRILKDTVDMSVRVMITGRTKSYPRQVKIVSSDSTTAVEGLNYEPLADRYIVEAGASHVDVPLRFLNHENIKTEERRLVLQLLPTSDFVLGIPVWPPLTTSSLDRDTTDVTRHTIFLTGAITQPPGWSGSKHATTGVETAQWGVFSLKKYLLMCELCHITYVDFGRNGSSWQIMVRNIVAAYLKQKYDDRDPVLEDDGRLMWVSGVSWSSIPGVPWNGQY
jgi:hypothetical protein